MEMETSSARSDGKVNRRVMSRSDFIFLQTFL
jgi:hypothetical protein